MTVWPGRESERWAIIIGVPGTQARAPRRAAPVGPGFRLVFWCKRCDDHEPDIVARLPFPFRLPFPARHYCSGCSNVTRFIESCRIARQRFATRQFRDLVNPRDQGLLLCCKHTSAQAGSVVQSAAGWRVMADILFTDRAALYPLQCTA